MNSFLDKTGLTYFWGKIKDAVSVKADKIQEVNHGTSDTTFTLTPNVMHIWGTVSSLNLSLPTDSNSTLDEYLFTFTCPTGGTTLTLPASIVWIQEPEFEEGKTYQVSIVNGLAGFLTNNMVAGGGSAPGTETDPIFKASPAYGIAASDITNWNGKQAALVSGTNIKTVNNESLLGSGNISIQGGGGDTNVIEVVKVNGTALTPDSNKAVDVPVPTESTVSGWGFTKNTGTYSKPSGGIPKTDLASAVQTSLGKADTALQSYTETDPVFTASAAHGITSSDIANWNNKEVAIFTINYNGSTWDFTSAMYTQMETALSNGKLVYVRYIQTQSNNKLIVFWVYQTWPTVANKLYAYHLHGSNTNSTITIYRLTLNSDGSVQIDDAIGNLVSSSDITNWNGKYSKPSGGIPASDIASGVIPTVPTNVSAFTNDANYVSSTNTVAIYSGSSAPSSSTGKNGDIYIQTS